MKRQCLFMDNIFFFEKLIYIWLEDILVLLFGMLMIFFGIILFCQVGVLIGGMVGMVFLIYYVIYLLFGVVFFVINLLFYWFFVWWMGVVFMLKIFCVVGLVFLFFDLYGYFIYVDCLNFYYVIFFGNIMVGIGFVVLFCYKVSFGGVNILVFYLQDKSGICVGKFQMVVDVCIVIVLLWVVSLLMLLVFIFGVVILNLIIVMNYCFGCYVV